MNKKLLIVLAFLLFNIGYGQGTINTSVTLLPALSTIYGQASNTDVITISGIDIDGRIDVTPPLEFEVSRDGSTFADAISINTPTGSKGNIAATSIYIRLKRMIAAKTYLGNLVLTSPGASNVNVRLAPSTVNKAPLTIEAELKEKIYGDENPSLTATYSGFITGENINNLTIPVVIETIADKTTGAGEYDIVVSGGDSPNYMLYYFSNVLTIKKAPLTIAATSSIRDYGKDNLGFIVSYSGFKNEDNETNLTIEPEVVTTADKTSSAGAYDIAVSGADSPNYNFTYTKGILTIKPVSLVITADNLDVDYGVAIPVLTAKYVGFANGDTPTSLGTTFKIETAAIKGSAAGKYDIVVSGADSPNYNFTYTKGVLTIKPVDLIITANNESKTHGDENPILTVSYNGLINGDLPTSLTTLVKITTTAVTESVIGEYEIIVTEASSLNYNIKFVNGILKVVASSNAGLSDIVVSKGDLDPAFDTDKKDYTVKVPNDINSYVINPIPTNPNATVVMIVDGVIIDPTAPLDLKVGDNEIKIVVTAEDGITKEEYTVIVTREEAPLSNNAGLIDLAISEGFLHPGFTEGNTEYITTVPNGTTTINVTPVTADATATVTVNGVPVPSGIASGEIKLEVGENIITTKVFAEDGVTFKEYTVIVTREEAPLSNNAGLTDLAISKGDLYPGFKEETTNYTANVPNDITSIAITPVSEDATATITVNGIVVPSGTASQDLPLQVGENVIITKVTAQDGTVTTYTVIVTRAEATAPDNAGLSDIVISDGALSPAFNTDTNDYRIDVPNSTDSIIINPKPIDPAATVEMIINGTTISDNTAPIALNVGDNVITVVVTAPDGTQDTYTIIVNRADASPQTIIPTNIITPNGDGKNDFWIIPGIELYPNNSVKVFDRAARLVYSKNNYNNEWDGSYKGSPLNEDTYYYLIDLGSGQPKIKGFITIVRN